jgi:ribonucleoside-diphosphate reductase alpha chain
MNNYLPTDYQSFIHTSRYARWLDKENRRENWGETVSRYMTNVVVPKSRDEVILDDLEERVLTFTLRTSGLWKLQGSGMRERGNVLRAGHRKVYDYGF